MKSLTKEKNRNKKQSVEKRLRSSYLTILTILIACIIVSVAALFKTSSDYEYAIINYGFSQGYCGQLGIEFNTMTTNLRNLILEQEEAEIETIKETLEQNTKDIDKYLNQVKDAANTEQEDKILSEMDVALTKYREIKEQVITMAAANQNAEAYDKMTNDGLQYSNVVKDGINQLLELNIDKCNDTVSSAKVLSTVLIIVMVVLGVLAVAIGLTLSRRISNSICEPLKEVTAAAEKLKIGELDIDIAFESSDELGVLAESFRQTCDFMQTVIRDITYLLTELSQGNFRVASEHTDSYIGEFKKILDGLRLMRNKINSALLNINTASEQVSAGSNQMAESAQGLAEGATEQAGAVEELTATIEEVASTMTQNAEEAKEAYHQAIDCEKEAKDSNDAMIRLTEAMERINNTSQKIANIIGEIEDIASQTNLLSLNAAIEAARAGDAGKGFAVVADQISKLASDSAQSAVNTRELIESSIEEVTNGNKITEKTSHAINRVVDGVSLLGKNAQKTSESVSTQAESMRQLQEGIEQISSVVQSNSAAAEETSATSEELSAQAISLNEEVDRFRLLNE